jgi:phosphatidylethanolamine/phosphatidyl-N-methylethanolamine N-methyltransferase
MAMTGGQADIRAQGTGSEKGDWLRFFATWARSPLKVGAIAASSPDYCAAMVEHSTVHLPGRVLELGAGTGVVTRALLEAGVAPERITSVEYDPAFAKALKRRFPGVDVICGDGLDLTDTLAGREDEKFASVLLAIPIVRFPQEERRRLLSAYFERVVEGGNVTQLSYSLVPPVRPDPALFTVRSSAVVWANIPPARIWIYERA